jgi:UDP-2,3-diacylglucosamine hydrolase
MTNPSDASPSAPPPPGKPRNLGILAGGGTLPLQVANAARAAGRGVFVVGLEGFVDRSWLPAWPHEIIRMGAAGRIKAALLEHECRDLVLIGPVRRPSFFDMRPDALGARIMARVGRAAFTGDDGLLAAVVKVIGEEGFQVLGAHEILKEALGPRGVLTQTQPDAAAMADIARGVAVARALGAVDVGQGCVVQQGVVLAVEALEGTDAMLARCAPLRLAAHGGVLVKLVKPGQDRRVDLPTVGPGTIAAAAQAGLRGIAFEAAGAILVDRTATVAAADQAGLFLLGLDADEINRGS